MRVQPLYRGDNYFQISTSSVEWWTAFKEDGEDWYIVNRHGRTVNPVGKTGKKIVSAIQHFQKMEAVRKCIG